VKRISPFSPGKAAYAGGAELRNTAPQGSVKAKEIKITSDSLSRLLIGFSSA
jgi:hypothetical protein